MMTYEQLLAALAEKKDETYRQFNERIVNVPAGTSIGVRTPLLRAFGKELVKGEGFDLGALLAFPNDVFEVRLLKCFAVGYKKMPFAEKVRYIEACLPSSTAGRCAICSVRRLKRSQNTAKNFCRTSKRT